MFSPYFRLLAVLLAMAWAPVATLGAEPEIIAKARAYLGSEEALNAVKSVHYIGTMTTANPSDPAKPVTVSVDIIFQAPFRQRTVRVSDTLTDTIALDTYEGWHRVEDSKDSSHWRVQVLPVDQVKRQRAVVRENLSFFRGLDQAGGKIVDLGSTTLDGVPCRKIAFIHSAEVIFFRYFNEANGRLVRSDTEGGNSIREQGEIRVKGVRFPKVIINTSKSAEGVEQTVAITFDTITVNETFPDSVFAVPSFSGK